ncbi:MAG: phosphonate ABC transporter substrate-binding protein [Burkholderiales bacterium]|jgi:phosphonate transport system substrate-binding protein
MKHLFAAACVAAGVALSGAAVAQTVNFGLISTESSSNLKSAWQPVLDDMARATGLEVKAFFAPDYAGVIEGMRFNKVQVAWMGNKSAMEAVDRASAEVFAKTVNKDGTEGYYSLLVVHKDSPLKSLEDVIRQRATLTLGFGDPNSTSGTAVPGFYAFGQNRVDPTKDFRRMVRANHETNLLAVVSRQVDVATNNTDNLERFAITNPDRAKDVREIWRSPMIASDPIVWRKDLDPTIKAKIRDFLLGYGKTDREKQNLALLGQSGWRASNDAQLVPIRQLELARIRSTIEGDAALSGDERTRRLAEIDGRLAELARATPKTN